MLETAEERIKLLKAGLSEKEIEILYIEHNNFKIIRTPILYEANEFENASSIFKNKRNSKSIWLVCFMVFILALFVPISTLFLTSVLVLLFVPPIFALAILLIEGKSVISKEFMRLQRSVKKPIVISI
jgi:hypothetical protein